jgi:hypothetical protein
MNNNYLFSNQEICVPQASSDVQAYTGKDFSQKGVRFEEARSVLLETAHNLRVIATARNWCDTVNAISNSRAITFIEQLPTNRVLPKISADSDGDVLFFWDDTPTKVALTIEGYMIYLSINPGEDSVHFGPITFSGKHIPPLVLDKIPQI